MLLKKVLDEKLNIKNKTMKNTINQVGMEAAQNIASSLGAAPVAPAPAAPAAPVPVATAPPAVTPAPVADVAIPPVLDPLVQATNPNFSPNTQNAALNMYGDAVSRGY